MSVRCPDGHLSQSDDYCDVCGLPIGATVAAPTATPAAAPGPTSALDLSAMPATTPVPGGAAEKTCPNCQSQVPDSDLFCEVCGYDFTTGALPAPVTMPGAVVPATSGSQAQIGGPAVQTPPPLPTSSSQASPAGPASPPPGHPDTLTWVAEIWVDPDWYSTQESDDPCPSAGLPVIVPLWDSSVLVGRASRSRNIHPQVDAGADHGVSRRHAQLTTDGRRWWAEDLESANGTFIAPAGAPLPTTPIPAHQRTEFNPGDRVYVGAWTRVVVRNATPDER